MSDIINVLLKLTDYFNELADKLDTFGFETMAINTYIGYARYCIGETAWTVLMVLLYVSAIMLLFKIVKGFVEFVVVFLPFF